MHSNPFPFSVLLASSAFSPLPANRKTPGLGSSPLDASLITCSLLLCLLASHALSLNVFFYLFYLLCPAVTAILQLGEGVPQPTASWPNKSSIRCHCLRHLCQETCFMLTVRYMLLCTVDSYFRFFLSWSSDSFLGRVFVSVKSPVCFVWMDRNVWLVWPHACVSNWLWMLEFYLSCLCVFLNGYDLKPVRLLTPVWNCSEKHHMISCHLGLWP